MNLDFAGAGAMARLDLEVIGRDQRSTLSEGGGDFLVTYEDHAGGCRDFARNGAKASSGCGERDQENFGVHGILVARSKGDGKKFHASPPRTFQKIDEVPLGDGFDVRRWVAALCQQRRD